MQSEQWQDRNKCNGNRVHGLGCRIWDLGFGVCGLGFKKGFRVQDSGFRNWVVEVQIQGLRPRV